MLDLEDIASREVRMMKHDGGDAIVELTCGGLSPDPDVALRKLQGETRPLRAIPMETRLSVSPVFANGVLYVAGNNRIRAIRSTLPALGVGDMLIASADGGEFYRFSSEGRHLSTLDGWTGSATYQFAYTSSGRLASVTDADGNVTVVERSQDGTPNAITSPFGAPTRTCSNDRPAMQSLVK